MNGLRLRASADGWRGVIGQDFTPSHAGVLAGCVVACVGRAGRRPSVLVTYDGRRAGAEAAAAAARAAREAGARPVRIVRHLPTPTATAAVRLGRADLAVLITASHNPSRWNGVKVKLAPGRPPTAALEAEFDAEYAAALAAPAGPVVDGGCRASGAASTDTGEDLVESHITDVLRRLPGLRPSPLRVTVDGLGGIAGEPLAVLCERLGWRVTRVACRPDPDFGGGTPDPSVPASRRRAERHTTDLAFVLDGDGDRIYVIDHRGRTVHPHELLALLLEHRARNGTRSPGIAVTTSTGTAVRTVAAALGVPVHETGVGFKHLSPLMQERKVDAAGGAVGDLSFAEFGLDRDPFAVVALLADLLARTTLADLLDDLRRRVGPLRWFELKVRGEPDAPEVLRRIALTPRGTSGIDGTKYWLEDGQWLLFRRSTTEGGTRVYGELHDEETVVRLRRHLVPDDKGE